MRHAWIGRAFRGKGRPRMPKRHGVLDSQRSLVARIEEIVLASSGADAFELVLALVAGRLAAGRAPNGRASIARSIDLAARRWPGLEPSRALDVSDNVLAEV